MKRLICLMTILVGLGGFAFAQKGSSPDRQLPPLCPVEHEKLFHETMDRTIVSIDEDKEIEVHLLLNWMGECDQKQNHGGMINRTSEITGLRVDQIRLLKKSYTYRGMLNEICSQSGAYWWIDDTLNFSVYLGPKSVYDAHKKEWEKRSHDM